MVRIIYYVFIFLLIFPLNLYTQENYEIRKVNFEGNKTLDKSFLLEKMAVDEISYLQKILTKKEPSLFNRNLIDIDVERLNKTYQSEGFISANVNLEQLKINERRKTVKLEFEINEGTPFTADTVILKLASQTVEINIDSIANKNLKKLALNPGDRFRDEALNQDMAFVQNIFRDLGYAYAEVNYELNIKAEEHLVGITYSVSPGPSCTFGETTITGNNNVSEKFIRKQIIYKEGEIYNNSQLNKTRDALYHLQLFRIASVIPEKDNTTLRNPIPVKVYVEEASRISTRFGVGYGTEDKIRAFVDFTYLGFLGSARRINIYAKHSALKPYYVSVKWIQPQIFKKKGSISINPFAGSDTEPGYKTRTYGVNLPINYRFNQKFNSSLTYYYENVEQDIEEGDPDFANMESDQYLYNKSGFLLSSIFSTAEPKFSPEKGVNLSLGLKLNGYVFGGDFSYMRIWGDFRTYKELGNLILAVRFMGGGIYSSDSNQYIPVEDRFYSGGSNSIRGWSRSELGPKRESGSPKGGKSIIESNLELRFPLFWKLSGVAFIEAGNVWEKDFQYQLNHLGYAAGGGLRIETPIGPIRFDVGMPLWNEKRNPQFFISVGQAF